MLASVPLGEMFGYATSLRKLSSGRANYSMEFVGYEQLNPVRTEEVLSELREKAGKA